jgi:hypothetical protein
MVGKLARRAATLFMILSIALFSQSLLAGTAEALTATKAELRNGQLRVEGHGAAPGGSVVIARSTTSAASARIGVDGGFKIQASSFTAPDCKVSVADGQTPVATVSLAGCSPSITPVPPAPDPPTGSCVITPRSSVTVPAGTLTSVYFDTTGCNTTFNSGATPTPVQWRVVAGVIPTGMTGPNAQGTTAANIIGTPSIAGSYRFTLQVTDQLGSTDQETFTLAVA